MVSFRFEKPHNRECFVKINIFMKQNIVNPLMGTILEMGKLVRETS